MNDQIGLVLEGGGMRGVYTAGVLEYFLEAGIHFSYVIGVSAGACNAASYISRQKGRNRKVTIDYVKHPRYLSLRNLFLEKSLFGMELLFDVLPNRLVPFDFKTFYDAPTKFWVGMTDAASGEPLYKEKGETTAERNMMTFIRASSSLPFVSPPVRAEDKVLFDGGITDPIPLRKSIADGNHLHVVVLTKPEGYRKKPFRHGWLAKRLYPEYPGLVGALERRYRIYNESLELAHDMRGSGKAVVISPSADLGVGRMTKDQKKLSALYELGYRDAEAQAKMMEWISNGS